MSVERSAGRLIGGAQHDHERPRALAVLAQQRQCPLRVIATPGHTPGHISLIDVRDGTLLAGDAVSTIGRTAVSGDLVWRWPFPAMSTWSKAHASLNSGLSC